MSGKSEHNEIIARAAKTHLAPLGCKRKGRSRVWLSDQRAWAIMVEFQPSGFSKGSYLNVAPCWLWHPDRFLSFGYGPSRINGFKSFEAVEQFEPEAEALAQQAARAVLRIRSEFDTPSTIAAKLAAAAQDFTCWRAYDAAVANGLIGDLQTSLLLFEKIISSESDVAWLTDLQNLSADLTRRLSDPRDFRERIFAIMSETRVKNKLPDDPHFPDDWRMPDA
jgi:hypothetical protein